MPTTTDTPKIDDATRLFDHVLVQALHLSSLQKVKLVEKLMSVLETEMSTDTIESVESVPKRSLYGVLAHLGPAPSSEEIDGSRREAWGNFPREDI